jgi:hypothetical protein
VRKVFWGLGFCWAFSLAAAGSTAYYAHHHPTSLVGKVMKRTSEVSETLSPIKGFAAVLKDLQQPPEDVKGVPADPEPIEAPAEAEANVSEVAAAPIVIPEDEPAVDVAEPKMPAVAIRQVQHEAFGPETECPPASVCRAPSAMPFCTEQEQEECEVLPMPAVEVDEEEQEACSGWMMPGCPAGLAGTLFRMIVPQAPEVIKAQPEVVDEDAKPAKADCPADPHHYQHMSCPNGGRPAGACPVTPSCIPSCEPPKPAIEEKPGDGESYSRNALRRLLRIKTRESIETERPAAQTYPGVDTMEMRPSDRPAGDHGPGLL